MHRHASLNRVYRLVWSHVHKTWVVVSETARGRGKRASRKLLLATSALAVAHLAQAGPTGGQVTAGSATIGQSAGTTTINQSSQNLSLLWSSFNTGAAETVNFVQPSAQAIAVNRITDTNATQFMGKLNANGQVYLINPNGVLFGTGSQVNVGGLVASTLDVNDASLKDGMRQFSGQGTGRIVNQGSINAAEGGYVAFLGNSVSNQGSISAPKGTVALGAGSDVTLSFAGNSLVNLKVNQSTLDNLAENGGLVRADGGAVLLSAGARDAVLASVVNNTGVIEARSVRNVGGSIVLDGGAQSVTSNSGTLDASGKDAGASGGSVKVLGDRVGLAATGVIDVSGDAGGGTALIGGNFLGAGPERNARSTSVAAGSTVRADAIAAGQGGAIAVWSDGTTQFDGSISARGGAGGGDGGQVETSGHVLKVGRGAAVTTQAPRGTAGSWLLDPQDLTIGGFEPGDGDIDGAIISAALQNNNVTIKTGPGVTCSGTSSCSAGQSGNGDIILAHGSMIGGNDWTSGTTLTLSAYRNIEFLGTGSIDGNMSTGSIILKTDNTGRGIGTVLFSNWASIYGNDTGRVEIYYNPTSYSAPTDYATQLDAEDNPIIRSNNLSTYMFVNLAANVTNKTYDGSTAGVITSMAPMAGLPAGITIHTGGATATFVDKTAGTDKAVTISGVTMSGTDTGKYALNGLDSKTASIAKADLALSGITANNKTYDATTAATLSGSAAVSAIGGDVVSVAGSGAGSTFATKNAGTGKAVTVGGYTLTGADAGNYNLVMPVNLTANVGKANLNVFGVGVNNKTYDGTTAATLSGMAGVTAFGSDAVAVGGSGSATFADKNAGAGKAVIVSGYTLSGADAGNYNLVQPTGLSATIGKANVAIGGIAAANKIYDGTSTATLVGSAAVSAFGGDAVAVAGSGSATFGDKNAGTNKSVTVSGYTLTGADAGNYNAVQPSGLTASIGKADLAISGVTANNKTYDGTAAAILSGFASVTPIGADVVAVNGSASGTFADKNAGSGKAVTVNGLTLSGADAGNYNAVQPTGLSADIGKATLAVSGVGANNKIYDGGTAAMLVGSATVAALGSDVVTIAGNGTASFADKNAGASKAVTATGFTLAGSDAGNYELVQPSGLTASIGKANLALRGVAVSDKVYDGTTAATLLGAASVAAIGGDAVTVSGTGTASFADKNAGFGKAVNVSGYTISGADAGNYNLVQLGGLTASIVRADLAISGITASGKTYDGTTAATLNGVAGVSAIGSDVVTVGGSGSGSFADKNAGSGKQVSVSGYTLTGADAGNYNAVQPTGLRADIGKATLAVSGVSAIDKTYDGTRAASLAGNATVAAFGSDVVMVAGSGSATFGDKNAGANKAVTATGFTLAGADAGNYELVQPAGLTASIGKANLALQGLSAGDKVYDGTTAATLLGTAGVAAFGGDLVAVSGSGTASFADRNAGANKAVNVSGYTLGGADADNYNLLQLGGLTASIVRADLAISGITASGKTYDGTRTATLNGVAGVSAIGSDAVSVSGSVTGSFADKNVGSGKQVTVTGYTLTGADAANYNAVQPTGLSADIGKATLAVSGVSAVDKTYDGTRAATLAGNATVAAIGSDVVTVAGNGSAAFADKNAGANKAVTATGFTLAGTDAGNYELVQPAGLTASIGKADLALHGVAASDKVYDGTIAATLIGSASVTAIGNDAVSVRGTGIASFADRNAGAGKAIEVSGYTLGGADAGNYKLLQPSGLTAGIARAQLTLSGLRAADKVYDGSTAAVLNGSATVAPLAGDAVSVIGKGTGSFADKNAGAGKAVSVSGYALGGADAGNYTLLAPAPLRASITPARLSVSGLVARDKVFDGGTAATIDTSGVVLAGKAGADSITVASTGSFSDAIVGNAKSVKLSNTFGGADLANYTIVDQDAALASITPAANLDQVRSVVTQVQSAALPAQASANAQPLDLSSTLLVSESESGTGQASTEERRGTGKGAVNTAIGFGPGAPTLRIQNGGMRLPTMATATTE
jgi:filamentous hemagglutinin family protein